MDQTVVGKPYNDRADKLKAKVRQIMVEKTVKPLDKLELIDALQRLGISYHFEDLIKSSLKAMFIDLNHNRVADTKLEEDLYATALKFRLLRQHGHKVPQEVFNRFKDEQGNFKESLYNDLKGMLYLYEATYYLKEGEKILDEARAFTVRNLKKYIEQYYRKSSSSHDEYLAKLVSHALEVPLAWGMLRYEAYWFINAYETNPDMDPILLKLAKLDFNMVQTITDKEDLKGDLRFLSTKDEESPDPIKTASTIETENSDFNAKIILNETNYDIWSKIIENHIAARGKLDYIIGNSPQPEAQDPSYAKWYDENKKVKTWLLTSMTPVISKIYFPMRTAREIWTALSKASYGGSDETQIFALNQRVFSLRQSSRPLTTYYGELIEIFQELDHRDKVNMKDPADVKMHEASGEKLRIHIFLNGLDDKFVQVRREILRKVPRLDLKSTFAYVQKKANR